VDERAYEFQRNMFLEDEWSKKQKTISITTKLNYYAKFK